MSVQTLFSTTLLPGSGPEGGAREEPFVEFLGEFLDDIFRKAGVLLEVKREDE